MHLHPHQRLTATFLAVLTAGVLCAVVFTWLHATDAQPSQNPCRAVHLSIDDVEAFDDLIGNTDRYTSVYEQPTFAELRKLHNDYGAVFTLYTYSTFPSSGHCLSDVPAKFRDDFRSASEWLRIGFHWVQPEFGKDITVDAFRSAYDGVNRAVGSFADSSMIAGTLRLHYFYCPDSLLATMTGTSGLLCADSPDRDSYDLTPEQRDSMRTCRRFHKNGFTYRPTDLRLENHSFLRRSLRSIHDRDTLVVFTHEWALNRSNIETAVRWFKDNGYQFTFL